MHLGHKLQKILQAGVPRKRLLSATLSLGYFQVQLFSSPLCKKRCALQCGGLPCHGCHLGRPNSASSWAFFRQSRKGSCQGAQHSSCQCYHCPTHAGGIADGNPPVLRQRTEWRLPCSLIDYRLSVTARPRCGVQQASKLSQMHCPQFTLAVGLTGQVSLSKVLFLEQGTLRTPSLATVTPCTADMPNKAACLITPHSHPAGCMYARGHYEKVSPSHQVTKHM